MACLAVLRWGHHFAARIWEKPLGTLYVKQSGETSSCVFWFPDLAKTSFAFIIVTNTSAKFFPVDNICATRTADLLEISYSIHCFADSRHAKGSNFIVLC